MFLSLKEEVLAPHPENDDVVNDFDIEEEVIEVENRFYNFTWFACILSQQIKTESVTGGKEKLYLFMLWNLCLPREENLAKIARRVKDYKVEELNPPREGKRLLVLDVDYTLFGELLILHGDNNSL